MKKIIATLLLLIVILTACTGANDALKKYNSFTESLAKDNTEVTYIVYPLDNKEQKLEINYTVGTSKFEVEDKYLNNDVKFKIDEEGNVTESYSADPFTGQEITYNDAYYTSIQTTYQQDYIDDIETTNNLDIFEQFLKDAEKDDVIAEQLTTTDDFYVYTDNDTKIEYELSKNGKAMIIKTEDTYTSITINN